MSLLSQYLSIIPQKLSWITISTMPHSILENHWLVSVCSVICQILKRLSASSWTLEFWFFSLGVIIITVMVSNVTVGSNPWPVRWMWERNHLRELLTPPWEHWELSRAPSPRATRSSNGKKLDTLGTSGTYLPMAKSKTQTLSAKHGRTSELPPLVFVLDKESPYPLSLNRPSGFWDTEIQISIQRSSSGLLTIHWESPITISNGLNIIIIIIVVVILPRVLVLPLQREQASCCCWSRSANSQQYDHYNHYNDYDDLKILEYLEWFFLGGRGVKSSSILVGGSIPMYLAV